MPKTLLLADDSVVIQKLVGLSFANEDIELVTTDNGDDALTRAREITPDLVLADVVMPGKNGYEVCAAIKGDPQLSHVPFSPAPSRLSTKNGPGR
jgi:CheY-like chemotaxis protein